MISLYLVIRPILVAFVALCCARLLLKKSLKETTMLLAATCRDSIVGRGKLTRVVFLATGLFLAAIKISLDWAVLELMQASGNPRTTLGFWLMEIPATQEEVLRVLPHLLLALPFIWVGVGATISRLRDCKLSTAWVVLFFVPAINAIFFSLLCILPTHDKQDAHTLEDARWIPQSKSGIAVFSLMLSIVLTALAALSGAYVVSGFFEQYGAPLFLGVPFMLGFFSSSLYCLSGKRTLRECIGVSLCSLLLVGFLLLSLMIEGIFCISLAFPIAGVLTALGAVFGYALQQSRPRKREVMLSVHSGWIVTLLLGALPLTGDDIFPVTTSIEINAPREVVWQNVVTFSELPEPREWLFIHGLSYPQRARIEGKGVGAIRYCEFSTGPFIEPITVWDEPRELRFTVTNTPPALEEWNPFGHVVTAHMNGFFISHGGQFLLRETPEGNTIIDATTWYSHRVAPAHYWKIFSDPLLHLIHARVLNHIKALSESGVRV
jgi:hypothetical protein